jgi:hypothetical protein
MVAAGLAPGMGRPDLQTCQFLPGYQCGLHTGFIPFPGQQRRAEGPHDTGDVRPDGFPATDQLEGAQHGLIVESTALHYNVFTHLGGVGDFYHF